MTPLIAPSELIFNTFDVRLNVPVLLPIAVFAVPVVFRLIAPVAVNPPPTVAPFDIEAPPLRVLKPVTARVLLNVVAPPTFKVLEPVIDVGPFSEIAPVPVPNVPLPLIAKLPLDCT